MASLAAVNSFAGLKVQSLKAGAGARTSSSPRAATVVCSSAGSPWEKVGKALVATSAGILIATSSANAAVVKLGADGGALVFVPSSLSVAAGETISFTNNAGFPHNIVFDEDAVPSGVDASKISQEEYLNAPGATYEVALTVPGTYEAYCEPHQGAGMKISISVK